MAALTRKSVSAARCACGGVEIEAYGAPIVTTACYCDDCQEGARQIELLANAPAVRDRDGGTNFVLFRKDRVKTTKGDALLKAYKLQAKSPTNRVVATCCNSAMVLNFDDSKHWVSMYRARFDSEMPPVEMRICTKSKRPEVTLPTDVPSHSGYPAKFMLKLVAAAAAMLLRR